MRTAPQPREVDAFLPLKPDLFQILLALSEEDLHGYGIMKSVASATDGRINLEPSPLYRRLKRLHEAGIVVEGGGGKGQRRAGPRRRYYTLTEIGRQLLAEEAARLVELATTRRVRKLAAVGRAL